MHCGLPCFAELANLLCKLQIQTLLPIMPTAVQNKLKLHVFLFSCNPFLYLYKKGNLFCVIWCNTKIRCPRRSGQPSAEPGSNCMCWLRMLAGAGWAQCRGSTSSLFKATSTQLCSKHNALAQQLFSVHSSFFPFPECIGHAQPGFWQQMCYRGSFCEKLQELP